MENWEVKSAIEEKVTAEREKSDRDYAIKLVEKIVFSGVALVLTSVVIAILALIIKTVH